MSTLYFPTKKAYFYISKIKNVTVVPRYRRTYNLTTMYIFTKTTSVTALICFLFYINSSAQISDGGKPISFQKTFQQQFSNDPLDAVMVPAFDIQKAKREDEQGGNSRFAAPIAVNYSLDENGQWTDLDNGDRVWRMELYSKDALGMFVFYEDFYLPQGGRFYMYNQDGSEIKGAYTSRNNQDSGKFMTGMIKGETVILEYFEPRSVRGQGIIDVSKIYYAYENDFEPSLPDNVYKVNAGYGDAAACHTNINCPEGDDWQEHKRGVVRILRVFDEGMGWCSGSLINNTSEDETPYVLSAYHCYDGFTPQLDVWRFDFSYESAGCADPMSEPSANSMLGCNLRAGWSDTDVLLLELLEDVPGSYNARFNGWNRTLSHLPDTSTIIHHPRGDIQKISQDYNEAIIFPTSINWSNGVTTPPNHHYEVFFDLGTFEDGSSGSNMLDEDGRIVGQLHGGNASCSTFQGFFGRFSLSWDEGPTAAERLMEWLDPENTGQLILDALEPVVGDMITVSGNVEARTGQNMSNVEIVLITGSETYTTNTDTDGNYSIEVPDGFTYTLEAHKNIDAGNGVSTFDIVKTSRHLLFIEPFTEPYQDVAADVTNDGNVSSFDIIRMRQVILNINDEFPESESWRFSPLSTTIDASMVVDLIGIKIGDPSGNANPN